MRDPHLRPWLANRHSNSIGVGGWCGESEIHIDGIALLYTHATLEQLPERARRGAPGAKETAIGSQERCDLSIRDTRMRCVGQS